MRANKEIASQLNISERTVKFHVSNFLAKHGVRRRADLIVMRFQEAQLNFACRKSAFRSRQRARDPYV